MTNRQAPTGSQGPGLPRGHRTPARRRLSFALVATLLALPLALALADVQIIAPVQVRNVEPAKPAAKEDAKADAKEEKKKVVDAELEKEIAQLEKELEALKKGTSEYDVKESDLKKKQRLLQTKEQAQQRKEQQELQQAEFRESIINGASLQTDTDTDIFLDRARGYADEGRFRDACMVWQNILDERPGLTTWQAGKREAGNDAVLRPVGDLVERQLASLPPEGLVQYRITADAEARAVLAEAAQDGREIEGLTEVVRRFFVSSLGDDAAYRLACIHMDEWDFVTARRLLDKIVHHHPDPSIPRHELLLRLALAHAKSGDAAGARETLNQMEAAAASVATSQQWPADWMVVVRRVVEAGTAALTTAGPVRGWPMALGTATRDGVMAGLPGEPVKGDALWIDQELLKFDHKVPERFNRNQMMSTPQQSAQGRPEIVTRWEKGNWSPTAQVLLRDGMAFFKTHNELRWYDLNNRTMIDRIIEPGVKLPAGARVWSQNYYYYGQQKPDTPTSTEEIAMFGDRIAKSMSLIGDTIYHVEGRVWMNGPNSRLMVWNENRQTSLELSEQLCAVDVSEAGKGKRVRWRYPEASTGQSDLRFLAAPVPSGDRLLVPVIRNRELYLDGLDAKTGKAVWSTFMCMPPNDDSSRWAPVGVSVIGSEAYVATGHGVVLAVDAGAGNILWASRYQRSEASGQNNQFMAFNRNRRVDLPGWSDDVIIPVADKLVVLASDSDEVICLSRLTGEKAWSSPRAKATYVLGVLDDSLYVAGPKTIRRYGLKSGKLERDLALTFDSFARGALTPQGIYMPSRGEIVRLDPQTLESVGKLRVATNSRDPIGNLFCDGDHLVAAGLDRVYALSDGQLKMKELSDSIAKADGGALRFERAFLYEVMGRKREALEDLRAAHRLLPAGADQQEASRRLLMTLLVLARNSDEAMALFDEAERVATPLGQQVRVWLARADHLADRGEAAAALDLLLRAAADTSDALVQADDEGGQREAQASLIAASMIRALVAKSPAIGEELTRRGDAALKPHMELAAFEKTMSAPDAALPQAAAIEQLEKERQALEKASVDAAATVKTLETGRDEIDRRLAAEKAAPTGQLEALTAELAAAVLKLTEARKTAQSSAQALADKTRAIQDQRTQMAGLLQRANDLKANRVEHAQRLLMLGDLHADTPVQLHSHILAARYLWNEDWFERAELVLLNLSTSSNPQVAAAGSVALARAYEGKQWELEALRVWATIRRNLADVEVEHDGRKVKAGDLAQAALVAAKVTGPDGAIHLPASVRREMPGAPFELAWRHQGSGHYLIETDDDVGSQFLEDHLMLINAGQSRIICKNVHTGADLWHMQLERNNRSGTSTSGTRIIQVNGYNFSNGRFARQGHVALLSASDRLVALGLTSGRTLWESSALTSPDRQNWHGNYYGQVNPMTPVAIGSGVVAEYGVSEESGAMMVRALGADTGKVRWRAFFPDEQIVGLNAAQGCVFVFVNNGTEVIICDAATGRRTGRLKFNNRQPQSPIHFSKHGMLVVNTHEATLYELPTGQQKWTASLRVANQVVFTGFQRIERINDNRVCIVNGGLFMLDIPTGQIVAQTSAADMGGRYLNDAAASPDGREIVTVGYGNENQQTISVVDTATGKVKSKINLGPRVGQQIQASKVASGGELIPVMIPQPPRDLGGGRFSYSGTATLAFYRKSDGQRMDVPFPGGESALQVQNAQSPLIRGDTFIILSHLGMTAYRRTLGAPPVELKPFVEPEKKDDPADGKDDKKGAAIEAVPAIPQILPGVPRARIIINGGRIEINGKDIKAKPAEKDKAKDAGNEKDAKAKDAPARKNSDANDKK